MPPPWLQLPPTILYRTRKAFGRISIVDAKAAAARQEKKRKKKEEKSRGSVINQEETIDIAYNLTITYR